MEFKKVTVAFLVLLINGCLGWNSDGRRRRGGWEGPTTLPPKEKTTAKPTEESETFWWKKDNLHEESNKVQRRVKEWSFGSRLHNAEGSRDDLERDLRRLKLEVPSLRNVNLPERKRIDTVTSLMHDVSSLVKQGSEYLPKLRSLSEAISVKREHKSDPGDDVEMEQDDYKEKQLDAQSKRRLADFITNVVSSGLKLQERRVRQN